MFSIKDVLEILETYPNGIQIEEITKALCKKYKVIFDSIYLNALSDIINENSDLFRLKLNGQIEQMQSSKFLYVSDNKFFEYEFNVLNEVFGYSYSRFQKGGKGLKDGNFVWFPEINKKNVEWLNTYSKDGKTWTEQPLTDKAKAKCSKELEKCIRYVFIHEDKGYRFTGVFRQTKIDDNLVRTYELIDDKVAFFKKPKMMICNIGYMKKYQGISDDDVIVGGHKHFKENKDGGEVFNFLRRNDGFTYGFVETNYIDNNHQGELKYAKKISIEKIDYTAINKDSLGGVRVVFISKNPNDPNSKNFIVGWYDNATVYRKRMKLSDEVTTNFGYNICCKNDDSHLIPHNERIFQYPKKNDDGVDNFGQASISYPYSSGKESTISLANKVNKYIDSLLNNIKYSFFYEPVNLNQWPMFEEVSGVGHKEYFLATKDMKIGDILLLHIGVQKPDVESGIYAIAKVIEAPNIYQGNTEDYCNGKLSVLTEIIRFSKECILKAEDFGRFTSTFRSVHKIDSNYYSELINIFNL